MSSPRGIARLSAMFDNWMKRTSIEIDSGCIYISGAVEFDDRTGPVRDALASSVMTWHAAMRRAIEQCKDCGELRRTPTKSRCCSRSTASSWRCTTKPFPANPGLHRAGRDGFSNILARYRTEGAAAQAASAAKAAPAAHRPSRARRKVSVSTTTPPRSKPMPTYTPPLRDMQFVMHEVFKVTDEFKAMPQHAEVDVDTINAVIEEAGKFASEVIFPLNISGDTEGCVLDKATHEVKTPTGFKEAYDKYVEGGWAALSCDPAYGGQGLPFVLNQCLYEMMNSANQAWTMYPGLSHGAYEALHAHGTDEQKKLYLPKLTSGEWTGTMCLTEPHCGTDLGLLRTKAEPQADGTYKLTGNKIFISAGEHSMVSNIVHLVLARLPDAPKGSKGISLFVVPKFKVNADGSLGERNPIYCTGLEHKMGIHGNATAQIAIDGAIGTLVGQPHKGLAAMFVMMNAARLGVGNQSLGLTEVAFQNALAYARTASRCARSAAPSQGQGSRSHHRAPRCAQDAAHRQGLRRRRPRAADLLHAAAGQGAQPPRRKGACRV